MALQVECDACDELVNEYSLINIEYKDQYLCSVCINDLINDLAYRVQLAEAKVDGVRAAMGGW